MFVQNLVEPTAVSEHDPRVSSPPPAAAARDFAAFYDRQWAPMVQLAFLTLGSREQAEDVVQEAFARVHQRWRTVDHPVTYARAAVMNGCRDHQRRAIRYRSREARLHEPDRTEDAPDELWDALARLRPRQRAALVLRYYAGLQEPEIAEALGVRPGTVKSLLHRGLEELRKEIRP